MSMSWEVGNDVYKVAPTEEPHLWRILQVSKNMADDQPCVKGYVAVYVDDLLVGGDQVVLDSFFEKLKSMWRCSQEEMVEPGKWTRFCGYELREDGRGGMLLSQESYLRDLVKRREVEDGEAIPIGKIQEGEDEEQSYESLRECQALIGEVQWVAGRTRPDICYSVGVLSRLMHRRPRYVKKMMMELLRYLRATVTRCLHYRRPEEDQDLSTLVVATDASFGPEHEQFRSITGVVIAHAGHVLHWLSCRQAFITQSTCEAELMAFTEGYQAGESTASLLGLMGMDLRRELVGDNKAAIAQVVGDTGPWRTRHLRIRAAKFREAIKSKAIPWTARHLDGALLVADGCTKALQGQAFRSFVERLEMMDFQEKKDAGEEPGVKRLETLHPGRDLRRDGSMALLGGGLAILCGGHRQNLGLLMMACGGLLYGWEYQDRKKNDNDRIRDQIKTREEGSNQESHDSGSGAAGVEDVGVTGTPPPDVNRFGGVGNKKPTKTQQDPQRTDRDQSGKGTTKPRRDSSIGKGTSRYSSQNDWKEEGVDIGVGRREPGIRAFRMNRRGDGRSHEDAATSAASTGAAEVSGAAARGKAGMVQMDTTARRPTPNPTEDQWAPGMGSTTMGAAAISAGVSVRRHEAWTVCDDDQS